MTSKLCVLDLSEMVVTHHVLTLAIATTLNGSPSQLLEGAAVPDHQATSRFVHDVLSGCASHVRGVYSFRYSA